MARAATSGVTVSTVLASQGGRLAYERADNALLSDPQGAGGYRNVWRYLLDPSGSVASSTCLTCGNPDMPYHNGNPRYDPFGRGFMFQVENKACDAVQLGDSGGPASGVCNDWWWWAAGDQKFYQITKPSGSTSYAQMYGKWSKNADYFVYSYRLPYPCTDANGCNFGGSWEMQAAEITWTNRADNVYVPQFGTIHHYSPGKWPNHFYQVTGASPIDNGVVVFESNSLVEVSSPGDLDVATMRVRDSSGNWLSSDQASVTVTIISEFSTDGSHTAEWNELADFTPDGTQIQWMSNSGYPAATGLNDLYSDYWRCRPDGSNKHQISFFNAPGHPESSGQRTIASNFVFQNVNQFFGHVLLAGGAPDNIYKLQTGSSSSVVVTNAATFFTAPGVSPGGLAAAFVVGLTGFSAAVAGSLPWQTELAGVQLAIDGVPAPLYYVGPASGANPGQINFQVPSYTQTGQAGIQVSVNGSNVAEGVVTVVPVSPGVFVTNGTSLAGAVLNRDYALNAVGSRASRGSVVQIFGTGGGPTLDAIPDGVAPPATPTAYTPKVYFGDAVATVAYSGISNYPGMWQINAYVPDKPAVSGLVPMYVVQDGVPSNVVTLWIEP